MVLCGAPQGTPGPVRGQRGQETWTERLWSLWKEADWGLATWNDCRELGLGDQGRCTVTQSV